VAEPLFLLVDSAIVGRIGTVPLGGLGVASQALTTLVNISIFLAYGTTAAVARGRRRDLGRLDLDSGHHGSSSGLLAVHVDALRNAGFAEVGTLWQRGDNRLLCAVLGG
jgi:hypothetical protein